MILKPLRYSLILTAFFITINVSKCYPKISFVIVSILNKFLAVALNAITQ